MREKKTYWVSHRRTPAEPYGHSHQRGIVSRVAPGGNGIPALAYILWDSEKMSFSTWEKCSDLKLHSDSTWETVRRNCREKN